MSNGLDLLTADVQSQANKCCTVIYGRQTFLFDPTLTSSNSDRSRGWNICTLSQLGVKCLTEMQSTGPIIKALCSESGLAGFRRTMPASQLWPPDDNESLKPWSPDWPVFLFSVRR